MTTDAARPQTPPDRVDAVQLLGCKVMAGRYSDRDAEVRLWPTDPHSPEVAALVVGIDVDARLMPAEVDA